MKKGIIIFASLLFAVTQGVFAQKMIIGKVVDANDESSMPGVNITVKGIPFGTTTDIDGNFALRVPNDAIIVISFTGYKTIEMPVENETDFDITLEPDVKILGDVVVTADKIQRETVTTAMGIERDKETLTTAVYQMSGDELRKAGSRSIAEGLIGKVPNLNTYVDAVDGLVRILYLRPISSFGGTQPPLYVIDGVPLSEDPTQWLNIEDIESVTVLPSANAAILYGSQGVYGAIIITTKK